MNPTSPPVDAMVSPPPCSGEPSHSRGRAPSFMPPADGETAWRELLTPLARRRPGTLRDGSPVAFAVLAANALLANEARHELLASAAQHRLVHLFPAIGLGRGGALRSCLSSGRACPSRRTLGWGAGRRHRGCCAGRWRGIRLGRRPGGCAARCRHLRASRRRCACGGCSPRFGLVARGGRCRLRDVTILRRRVRCRGRALLCCVPRLRGHARRTP